MKIIERGGGSVVQLGYGVEVEFKEFIHMVKVIVSTRKASVSITIGRERNKDIRVETTASGR